MDVYLFSLCEKTLEYFWALVCNLCKHLSIEKDVLVLQCLDEDAVLKSCILQCCIETCGPKASEIVLLVFSVSE